MNHCGSDSRFACQHVVDTWPVDKSLPCSCAHYVRRSIKSRHGQVKPDVKTARVHAMCKCLRRVKSRGKAVRVHTMCEGIRGVESSLM